MRESFHLVESKYSFQPHKDRWGGSDDRQIDREMRRQSRQKQERICTIGEEVGGMDYGWRDERKREKRMKSRGLDK